MRTKPLLCLLAFCVPVWAPAQMLKPAFTRQDQLAPVDGVGGWSLDETGKAEIEKILRDRDELT